MAPPRSLHECLRRFDGRASCRWNIWAKAKIEYEKKTVNITRSARPCESTEVASAILGTSTLMNLSSLSSCSVDAIERKVFAALVCEKVCQSS